MHSHLKRPLEGCAALRTRQASQQELHAGAGCMQVHLRGLWRRRPAPCGHPGCVHGAPSVAISRRQPVYHLPRKQAPPARQRHCVRVLAVPVRLAPRQQRWGFCLVSAAPQAYGPKASAPWLDSSMPLARTQCRAVSSAGLCNVRRRGNSGLARACMQEAGSSPYGHMPGMSEDLGL